MDTRLRAAQPCYVWLLILALVVAALPLAVQPASAHQRMSQELLDHLAAQPSAPVDLIVQVSGDVGAAEAAIVRLGGTVHERLALIGALAAQLPGPMVGQLAQQPSVRWLSIDAPLSMADEVGASIDYLGAWECRGSDPTSYAIETSAPHTGVYHIRLTGGATPARCEQRIRVQPNTRYHAQVMLKPATDATAGTLEVTALDAQGHPLPGERYTTTVSGSTSYTPAQISLTTGPQASFLSIVAAAPAPGATVLLDSASLERQSLLAPLAPIVANLLLNPSFEYGLSAGWLCPMRYAETVDRRTLTPNRALRIAAESTMDHQCEQGVNVTPGQLYRLSVNAQVEAPSGQLTMRLMALSDGVQIGQLSTQSAQSVQLETVIQVPAQVNRITLAIKASGEGLAYADNVVLKKCASNVVRNGQCSNIIGANLVENGDFERPAMYLNTYSSIIGHDRIDEALDGSGVTVAVVDSGIAPHPDLAGRLVAETVVISGTAPDATATDEFGHGTHVAGIIGGGGASSGGIVVGVAPGANLVNLKIFGPDGRGSTRDFVRALEWIYHHRQQYNIRVVNLSLTSSTTEHYSTNPLSAAMQVLWKNGVVVVVCAGNNGSPSTPVALQSPANDPFVITVGAMWDKNTPETSDDLLADYSAFGTITTTTGLQISKPDLVAPGSRIISLLAGQQSTIWQARPYQTTSGFTGAGQYYRMSGTSMAAPIVAASVAVLLQDEPGLTPDQVKYRLMSTARRVYANGLAPVLDPLLPTRSMAGTGEGYVDLYAALSGSSSGSANQGVPLNQRVANQGQNPDATWEGTDWTNIAWTEVDGGGRGLGGSMQVNVDWEPPRP